ncbi:MAG TPA: S9 family peptidase [Clostridiaceae bacterium]|nr:S9 family peptidase [Clostridiaceae bacterium]
MKNTNNKNNKNKLESTDNRNSLKKMKIGQFTEWSFIHTPQADITNDSVVFQVSKPDLTANKYQTNLWTYNRQNSTIKKLTNSDQDSSVTFLHDGNLLFTSGRTGKQQDSTASAKTKSSSKTKFWKINPSGGEAEFEFEVELNVNQIYELKPNLYLIHGYQDMDRNLDWIEIEDLPFWLNGAGYTTGIHYGLYLFDAELAKKQTLAKQIESEAAQLPKATRILLEESIDSENSPAVIDGEISQSANNEQSQLESGVLRLISSAEESVNGLELSPDKQKAIFFSSPITKVSLLKENLVAIDLGSFERQTISQLEYQVYSVNFIAEQNNLAYLTASDCNKIGLNQNPQIYLINLAENSITQISQSDFDTSIGSSVGSDARFGGGSSIGVRNSDLYYIATVRDKAIIQKTNPNGEISTVIEGNGSVDSFAIIDDAIYFVAMFDLNLPELYVLPLNNNNHCGNDIFRQLTHFSDQLADTELLPIEKFQFESNKALLDGFVIKPSDFDQNKLYPALLAIHGGPKTVYGTVLHHEMQYLAAQGYFVFFTNPHGSDGYGDFFSDIRGQYGTIDYQDLMKFTDLVLENYPQIDNSRLGCIGGSYGGFMVNWIIGHTGRFAAANSQRSISNWTSFYGVSDIGYYFTQDQTAANPWQNPEDAWNQSPLKYADQATTPTLFIHAEQDYRCPLEQGIQMYSALQIHDVDTKLVVFKNETHELSRSGKPQARIKRLAEIINWFNKYLK